MLNYIKAELWKALHHRITWGMTIFLVLCTALFGFLMNSANYAELVGAVSVTMLTGMLVVPLLVQVVDGNKGETLKNEISFGLNRGRIYNGKLLAGLLLGMALCVILVAGLLAICFPLLPHDNLEQERVSLGVLGFCLLGALPIWCGMLALCHAMAVAFPGTAVWMTAYYLVFFCRSAHSGGIVFSVYWGTGFAVVSGDPDAVYAVDAALFVRLAHMEIPALVLGHRSGLGGSQHCRRIALVFPAGYSINIKRRARISGAPLVYSRGREKW